MPSSISWIIPSFNFSFQFVLLHLFGLIVVNHVTKHVTIQLQHALENVSLDVDVLLDMFSMMVIVLNQNDARPMLNLKRKRILSNALTGEIKLLTTYFRIFYFFFRFLCCEFLENFYTNVKFEMYDEVMKLVSKLLKKILILFRQKIHPNLLAIIIRELLLKGSKNTFL